jgi:hypothetical protein
VVTGIAAAIVVAFVAAQVLDLKVQQEAADRFSTVGVRL